MSGPQLSIDEQKQLSAMREKIRERQTLEFREKEKRLPGIRPFEPFSGLHETSKRIDALGIPPKLSRAQHSDYDEGLLRLKGSVCEVIQTIGEIRALEERLRHYENPSPYQAREFKLVPRQASIAKHSAEEFLRLWKAQCDDAEAVVDEVKAHKALLEARLNELKAAQEATAQGDDGGLHS